MGKKGYTCLRRTFCGFNILIWVCGCGFLGAGLWLHLAYEGYASLLPHHAILSADKLFLTVGVLSFVVSFFGYCGSWTQSRCLIFVYILLVVLLFLSEFLLGTIAFVFRGGISRLLINELKFGIEHHYNVSDKVSVVPSVAVIWDHIQEELHCCGVTSYEDWYDISSWRGERFVPRSCCRERINHTVVIFEGSGDETHVSCEKSLDPNLWWDKGCAESVNAWIISKIHIVGAVALVIFVLQLIGLVCSMLLFYTIKYHKDEHTYKSYSPTIENNPRLRSYSDE